MGVITPTFNIRHRIGVTADPNDVYARLAPWAACSSGGRATSAVTPPSATRSRSTSVGLIASS